MPGCADLLRHRAQMSKHVDVVDHQVQHHVHVEAARAEHAEPVNLEEERKGARPFPEAMTAGLNLPGVPIWRMRLLPSAASMSRCGRFQSGAMGFSTSTSHSGGKQRAPDFRVGVVGVATMAAFDSPGRSRTLSMSQRSRTDLGGFGGAGLVGVDNRGEFRVRRFLGGRGRWLRPNCACADYRDFR